MKVAIIKPIKGYQAIEYDGNLDRLDEFLNGKSKDRPINLEVGSILISTYQGVVAMSKKDFELNYEVVWGSLC